MAFNFQPGEKVVCIDASDGRFGPSGLVKGTVYTIHRTIGLDSETGGEIVDLVEAPFVPVVILIEGFLRELLGYRADRFRRVVKPKAKEEETAWSELWKTYTTVPEEV